MDRKSIFKYILISLACAFAVILSYEISLLLACIVCSAIYLGAFVYVVKNIEVEEEEDESVVA